MVPSAPGVLILVITINPLDNQKKVIANEVHPSRNRKEVRQMKYAKPDIVAVIPAASAILGTKEKEGSVYPDAPLNPPSFILTPGAYEADE